MQVLLGTKKLQNFDESNALLYDVSSSVRTMLCKYCEATKDKNLEC
jgi:hypothetical protein